MKKTANYGLNLWEKTDRIQMEDFNADNAKIEAALSASPKLAIGSYTGTGNTSVGQTIELGFHPTAVLIIAAGMCSKDYPRYALVTREHPVTYTRLQKTTTVAAITESGFYVGTAIGSNNSVENPNFNAQETFCYLAFH